MRGKGRGYIYFLFMNKRLKYIGQTQNIYERMASYGRQAQFNSIRIIPCAIDKLRHYEARLIKYFQPPYNFHHTHKDTCRESLFGRHKRYSRKKVMEYLNEKVKA